MVPGGGIEPPRAQGPADFESAASASSAIPARVGINRLAQYFSNMDSAAGQVVPTLCLESQWRQAKPVIAPLAQNFS
jgi:hypothetical protein